jgi:hypothetical protein
MRLALAALLLLPQEDSVREKALKLARDPKANREALAALGPLAIRVLLEARTPELEPVIRDLKFARAGAAGEKLKAKLTERGLSVRLANVRPDVALGVLPDLGGVPVLLDPGLAASIDGRTVRIDLTNGTPEEAVRSIAAQLGLEYGFVRGHLLLSTPERLWAWPAEKPRVLSADELAALKEQIGRLTLDSVEARDLAAQAILQVGDPAVPHLEEAAEKGDAETKARLRDLVGRIKARAAPPVFAELFGVERQIPTEGERVLLRALEEKTVTLDVANMPLPEALRLAVSQADLEVEAAAAAGKVRVAVSFNGSRAIDALYLLTVPFGLDACFQNGKVRVDTRENVNKLIRGR